MANLIIRPVITEKMTAAGEELNRYGFIVNPKANKVEIKKAIKEMYGVEVESVNTMNYIGKKTVRYTKRNFTAGRKSSFKKAIVTLKKGDSIDFFANI